jgi:multiple sugar transport system substrate-binding protein
MLFVCFAMPSSASAANEDFKGELIFWSWTESETNGLAERFNKVYPNIKIKFVPVDSENFVSKLQTSLITNGEVPDVCLQEVDARGAMFALDCWENLEKAPYNFDRSIVFPQLLPTMTNDRDEVIGIERELNPSGLIYKRKLAEKYFGTQDPDEIAALISDWEKLLVLGEKIVKDSNGTIKLFAGLRDVSVILNAQYAESIFFCVNSYAPKNLEYILCILISAKNAKLIGKATTYSPAWNASFLDDTTIVYYAAPWTAQWVLKPNDPDSSGRWGMTSAPGKGYSCGGTSYGILSSAKNKELAWKFIEWATTTDDGTDACASVVGAIVSRKANYAKGFPNNPDPYFAGQDPNVYLMEKVVPSMQIRSLNQFDVSVADVMSMMVETIANDPGLTIEKAVQTAVNELKNKLPDNMNII